MVRTIVMEAGGISATITPDALSTVVSPNPEGRPFVPPDSQFGEERDYLSSDALEQTAWAIIRRYPEFSFLADRDAEICVVWKRKGGKTKGKETFGQCTKPSGLLKHYSGANFIIWIAADHLRESGWTNYQLEALLYHELKHCGYVIDEDDTSPTAGEIIGYRLVPHDSEVFYSELIHYGAWNSNRAALRDTWAQVALTAGAVAD